MSGKILRQIGIEMKKVSIRLIAHNSFDKASLLSMPGIVELNEFHEAFIKHEDFGTAFSFDALLDNGRMFLNGIWSILKSAAGLGMWSVIVIVQGVRWLVKKVIK